MQDVTKIAVVSSLLIFMLGACVSTPPAATPAGDSELKKELSEIHKTLGAQAAQIEELNQKLLLITEPKPVASPASENLPAPPEVLPVTQSETSGAERLYKQAVLEAKKGNLAAVQKNVTLLMKGFKESPWTNNALFLLGEKLFEKSQFLRAAEQYETLYKTFPDGNKAVPALYKLALCYEKLGKPDEATEAFQNVVAVYPGSKEALLAKKRLALTEPKSSKKVEVEP